MLNFNTPDMQAILLLIVGIVCIILGSNQQKKEERILENGVEAEGIIFKMEDNISAWSDSDMNNNTSYSVIRFVTKKLEWITEQYTTTSIFLSTPGKKVTVIYNPDNPKEFIVKTPFGFTYGGYIFIVIGIILLLAGTVMAFKYLHIIK